MFVLSFTTTHTNRKNNIDCFSGKEICEAIKNGLNKNNLENK
jgi:hypothetical protein